MMIDGLSDDHACSGFGFRQHYLQLVGSLWLCTPGAGEVRYFVLSETVADRRDLGNLQLNTCAD